MIPSPKGVVLLLGILLAWSWLDDLVVQLTLAGTPAPVSMSEDDEFFASSSPGPRNPWGRGTDDPVKAHHHAPLRSIQSALPAQQRVGASTLSVLVLFPFYVRMSLRP